MELTQSILDGIMADVNFHAATCKCCGRPILPQIQLESDGTLHFFMFTFELRGGLGNHVVFSQACETCAKKFRLLHGTNPKSE
jgi:hypothetical protein|nr:MAG TPA: hypothetical protein [Caudoviricetes sp.]